MQALLNFTTDIKPKHMSHADMILRYIKEEGSITTWEAFRELGITSLHRRLKDLKNKGHDFEKILVKTINRYGYPIKYYKYILL